MSFNRTQHYAVKRPFRRSLARSGIPDHSDVLAIYLRWVRQRYYRAHDAAVLQGPPPSAASTRSSHDALEALEALHRHDATTPVGGLSFDAQRLSTDLLQTGAGLGGDDALVPGYPSEIDLIG